MKRADGTKFQRTTPAQVDYIRAHWLTQTCIEIAAVLGMQPGTVRQQAKSLGLRKHVDKLSVIRKAARGHAATRGHDNVGRRVLGRKANPFALMLTHRAPAVSSVAQGRVHRILDDELEAA